MTPEERELIAGLFDRLQQLQGIAKDRDADQLIRDGVRQVPDAPYLLVQSVLVQEQALQQADARIRELEARVANLASGEAGSRASAAGGSFLAGAREYQSRPEGSVPSAGRQISDSPPQRPDYPQAAPQSSGGGFLSSALSTATGVTGGMLLAESIRGLFGGGQSAEGGTSSALERAQREAQTARNDADNARKDVAADDAALDDAQDALDDSDQDDWGDDGSYDA
ncbi:DUF2076 domain-containing protein [Hyphomicrobium sp.]|uniref:DUF2076 domain-containing protein n=1 Tax=Hyphomicrobium sp. TaxID=82 RepID=UPI002E37461D|nr:DUF2076 domain-containing protein [Hyphomicrobium sp.]HEX2843477.1 DUF2076 domain-containing protein [Hyphomicrobium sp.]